MVLSSTPKNVGESRGIARVWNACAALLIFVLLPILASATPATSVDVRETLTGQLVKLIEPTGIAVDPKSPQGHAHHHGEGVKKSLVLIGDQTKGMIRLQIKGAPPEFFEAGARVSLSGSYIKPNIFQVTQIKVLNKSLNPKAFTLDACLPIVSVEARGLSIELGGAVHPLTSIPALSSKPGAPANLYLDFVGYAANTWGGYAVPTTPAYDTDGDATTFSDTELANINEIWARVSEHYAPFNMNVTTTPPTSLAHGTTVTLVIGGSGAWLGVGAGGVSYVGSFQYSYVPNISWVFPSQLSNVNKYVSEAVAHEAGHAFGLEHQSTYSGTTLTNEYNPGDANRAPIMGESYFATRGLWWNGQDDEGSTVIQADLSVISSNGFGYRPSAAGNSRGNATPLSISGLNATGSGVIAQTTQTDYYSFSSAAGVVTFSATPATYGPDLDIVLELHDGNDQVLASNDPTSSLSASLSTTVTDGGYFLVVKSHGSYGDLGQYSISGTVAGAVLATPTPFPTSAATATPIPATPTPTATPRATNTPFFRPTATPTNRPTVIPTLRPTTVPTTVPTTIPTAVPTSIPNSCSIALGSCAVDHSGLRCNVTVTSTLPSDTALLQSRSAGQTYRNIAEFRLSRSGSATANLRISQDTTLRALLSKAKCTTQPLVIRRAALIRRVKLLQAKRAAAERRV